MQSELIAPLKRADAEYKTQPHESLTFVGKIYLALKLHLQAAQSTHASNTSQSLAIAHKCCSDMSRECRKIECRHNKNQQIFVAVAALTATKAHNGTQKLKTKTKKINMNNNHKAIKPKCIYAALRSEAGRRKFSRLLTLATHSAPIVVSASTAATVSVSRRPQRVALTACSAQHT